MTEVITGPYGIAHQIEGTPKGVAIIYSDRGNDSEEAIR